MSIRNYDLSLATVSGLFLFLMKDLQLKKKSSKPSKKTQIPPIILTQLCSKIETTADGKIIKPSDFSTKKS
jgi:hypothetical protein